MRTPRRSVAGRAAAWLALLAAVAVVAFVVARASRPDSGSKQPDAPLGVVPESAPINVEPATRVPVPHVVDSTARPTPAPGSIEGWRIEGRIVARDGTTPRDASVTIELSSSTDSRVLGEIAADAEGRFSQAAPALAALDPDRAPPVEVRVTVDARGFRPARVRRPIDLRAADRTARMEVRVEPGERVTGRIVDGAGRPVARASVALSLAGGADARRRPLEEVETGPDGRFLLGFTSSTHYVLQARHENVGTALIEELSLDAGEARALGDLPLVGGAEVRGTVRHPDGEPVAWLELEAFEEDLAASANGSFVARRDVRVRERGDGLTSARATTDESGAFRIRGLRPGRFVLRATDADMRLAPEDARVSPGARDVMLTLDAPRLVARVVDEDGAPVRGADVRWTELVPRPDGGFAPGRRREAGTIWPGAVATFLIPRANAGAQARVCLQATLGGRRGPEQIVDLIGTPTAQRIELRLPRASATGVLQIAVNGADGVPLQDLRVALESAVTGERAFEFEADADGRVRDVPVGTYHVVVGYAPGSERDHFPVESPEAVTVHAGETTTAAWTARRGARCTIVVSTRGALSPERGARLDRWRAAAGTDESTRRALDSSTRADLGVAVELTPAEGGAPRPVQFRPGDGRGLLARALPGETLVGEELFEPGLYTLSVTGETWRPVTPRTIRLDAGASTPESVVLEAP